MKKRQLTEKQLIAELKHKLMKCKNANLHLQVCTFLIEEAEIKKRRPKSYVFRRNVATSYLQQLNEHVKEQLKEKKNVSKKYQSKRNNKKSNFTRRNKHVQASKGKKSKSRN